VWFKRKRILPQQSFIDWSFEVWEWLLSNQGGYSSFVQHHQIIKPDSNDFPLKYEESHEWAFNTFNRVKGFMGMQEWPCDFEEAQGDETNDYFLNSGIIESYEGAAGTYGLDENGVTIRYSKSLLCDPSKFISTMAHELSHYIIGGIYHPNPGGPNVEEHSTDLCAIFNGFGIFMLNSYFSSSGFFQSTQGYLNESQIAFNLAIFCKLKNTDPESLKVHLKKNLYKILNDACDELDETYSLKITWLASVDSTV